MDERVTIEIRSGVADVRMIRSDKLNALDAAMFSALIAAGERLKTENGLRAVVLSGEGKAFCAGLDMGSFAAMMAQGKRIAAGLLDAELTARGANRAQQAVLVWRDVPVPVIAAVHGVAFGGGLQLALGADMRFVAPDARLAVLEIKWGLIPDMAGIALMRRLVRDDIARDLTYSGRIVSGQDAFALGLATRICENPREDALQFAGELASKSPSAIRAGKRLFDLAGDADEAAILAAEAIEQGALIGSAHQIEAVRANLENRPANFID